MMAGTFSIGGIGGSTIGGSILGGTTLRAHCHPAIHPAARLCFHGVSSGPSVARRAPTSVPEGQRRRVPALAGASRSRLTYDLGDGFTSWTAGTFLQLSRQSEDELDIAPALGDWVPH